MQELGQVHVEHRVARLGELGDRTRGKGGNQEVGLERVEVVDDGSPGPSNKAGRASRRRANDLWVC
jgi:hypothetical protein